MSTNPSGGQDPLSPVSKTTQVTPKINPPFSDQLISTLIFVLIPLQSPHPLPRTTGQAIHDRNVTQYCDNLRQRHPKK